MAAALDDHAAESPLGPGREPAGDRVGVIRLGHQAGQEHGPLLGCTAAIIELQHPRGVLAEEIADLLADHRFADLQAASALVALVAIDRRALRDLPAAAGLHVAVGQPVHVQAHKLVQVVRLVALHGPELLGEVWERRIVQGQLLPEHVVMLAEPGVPLGLAVQVVGQDAAAERAQPGAAGRRG